MMSLSSDRFPCLFMHVVPLLKARASGAGRLDNPLKLELDPLEDG